MLTIHINHMVLDNVVSSSILVFDIRIRTLIHTHFILYENKIILEMFPIFGKIKEYTYFIDIF